MHPLVQTEQNFFKNLAESIDGRQTTGLYGRLDIVSQLEIGYGAFSQKTIYRGDECIYEILFEDA